jgi:predicted dehydrogenase
MQLVNDDVPAVSVLAQLTEGADLIEGDVVGDDPWAHGVIQFENGVVGYALMTPRKYEVEIMCEQGIFTVYRNSRKLEFRPADPPDSRGRSMFGWGEFPAFEPGNSTVRVIEDLVHSLDTGEPTQGGVRVARANTELIIAFIESGRHGGVPVQLPLKGNRLRLQRDFDPTGANFRPSSQGARARRDPSFTG